MITVQGIVVPSQWDEQGNVLAVGISMANERELLVLNDAPGRKLFRYIRQTVEVCGTLRKNMETGLKDAIKVRNFRLTSEP